MLNVLKSGKTYSLSKNTYTFTSTIQIMLILYAISQDILRGRIDKKRISGKLEV